MLDVSVRAASRVWFRSFTHYRRSWLINLLPNFFEPVVYLAGMGIGLGAYIQQMDGVSYMAFLAPGLIVTNAMNGATFETTYNLFVKLRYDRTYDAITATPITIQDAMLGEVMWAMTRGFLYGVIFAIVVMGFGLISLTGLVSMIPVVMLTSWLFAAVGLVFTAYIKIIDLYSFFYTLFLTPMFLFSGIFYPMDSLPAWATEVAWYTPLYHCVILAKSLTFANTAEPMWVSAIWVTLVSLGLTWLGIRQIHKAVIR